MSNRLTNRAAIPHRLTNALVVAAMLLLLLPQAMLGQATDGPLLWLKFDEATAATSFADSGSASANGTCAGDACPTAGVTGRIGQAAQFDGVNDRVQANLNTPTGPYTLAAWVNFSGAAWENWRTVLEFGDDAPWFGVSPGGQLTLYPVINGGAVPLGQWTHVVYTWSGTENRLYINGQAVAVNTTTPPGGGQGLALGVETNGLARGWVCRMKCASMAAL